MTRRRRICAGLHRCLPRASVVIGTVAAAVVVGATPVARGQDAERSMHSSPHTEESDVLVGAKAMGMLEHVDAEEQDLTHAALGGGLYVELSLVPGWLELELGAVALRMPDETELTLEPLLKKNFHIDERVDLYLGLGPTIGVALRDEGDATLIVGGFAVLGGYLWIDRVAGVDLDITVELASVPEPAVAVIVGLGPVLRL